MSDMKLTHLCILLLIFNTSSAGKLNKNRINNIYSSNIKSQIILKESAADFLPGRDVCGQNPSDRIFGGEVADIGEFPWMALLEFHKEG